MPSNRPNPMLAPAELPTELRSHVRHTRNWLEHARLPGTHRKPLKGAAPPPGSEVTHINPSDSLPVMDEAEETSSEVSDDRVVLEQEPDDGHVLSLVDHDARIPRTIDTHVRRLQNVASPVTALAVARDRAVVRQPGGPLDVQSGKAAPVPVALGWDIGRTPVPNLRY
jgi:hypothetical protein